MASVALSGLQRDLPTTLSRVARYGERVVLRRGGKPVAALVPIEDLEWLDKLDELEDAYLALEAEKVLAEHDPADDIPADEFWKQGGLR